MSGKETTMYSRAFYGDRKINISFPDTWEISVLAPEPKSALSNAQRQAALDQPIGSPPISKLAQGKQSVAIIVDDLSRPTPIEELLPAVLNELFAAGVTNEKIKIVIGTGSHRPLACDEIALKIGSDIAENFQVKNHDFMGGDLRGMGNLEDGTPIFIDPVVANSELKICIGGVYPHGAVGFGGGSKLILPGVSGFATIFCFHTFYPGRGQGNVENQSSQRDGRDVSEEAAKLIGLDFVVNAVVNHKREVAGLFAGNFIAAQRQAAEFARKAYGTKIPRKIRQETDLLILNCYPLDSDPIQTGKALWPRQYFDRAYTVAINPACDGIAYHGLYDRVNYDRFLENRKSQPPDEERPARIGKLNQTLVWSEHFGSNDFYQRHPEDILFRNWDELIGQLAGKLPKDAKVAVFPFSSIQLLVD